MRYGVSMTPASAPRRRDVASSSRMRARARLGLGRQVADESEALAVQAARRERQRDRARAGQGDDADAGGVRRGDQPRARIGDRRQPGFADQAEVVAGERGQRAGARVGRRAGVVRGPSAAAAVRRSRSAAAAARAGRRRRRASGTRASSSRSRTPSGRGAPRRAACRAAGARRGRRRPPRCRRRARSGRGRACPASSWPRAGSVGSPSGSIPARRSSSQVRISGRPISAVGSSDSIALDAARCRASRSWRCRRSRRAARRAGSARSRRRSARESAPSPAPAPTSAKPVASQTTATAVWKTTVRPRIARSCAVARAWSPGLPMPSPSRSATWSEPITTASASRVGDGLRLREREARAGRAGCLAGARRLVDLGRVDVERQAQPRQQLAPVARGRGEDEAAARACRHFPSPPWPSFGRALHWTDGCPTRDFDPHRLDVAAFAAAGGELAGELAGGSPAAPGCGDAGAAKTARPRPTSRWRRAARGASLAGARRRSRRCSLARRHRGDARMPALPAADARAAARRAAHLLRRGRRRRGGARRRERRRRPGADAGARPAPS